MYAGLCDGSRPPYVVYQWVGSDGIVLGIERFGASAPAPRLFTELGMTVDRSWKPRNPHAEIGRITAHLRLTK